MEERQPFHKMMPEQLDTRRKKKERSVNLSLTLYASLSLDGSQTEVKMQHNNSFRKKNRRKSSGCRAKERVHRFDTKSKISERKFHQLDLIKIKIFYSVKHSLMKMKTQTIDWRKYLQTYLTKDQYLEYIKNSQNETEKKSPIRNGKIQEETAHQRRCANDK